jgi:hypothetical protein
VGGDVGEGFFGAFALLKEGAVLTEDEVADGHQNQSLESKYRKFGNNSFSAAVVRRSGRERQTGEVIPENTTGRKWGNNVYGWCSTSRIQEKNRYRYLAG